MPQDHFTVKVALEDIPAMYVICREGIEDEIAALAEQGVITDSSVHNEGGILVRHNTGLV